MVDKLVAGGAAGADGQHAGADGAAAADVVGRIADDEHFGAGEGAAEPLAAPVAGDASELVAVFVVIAEGAQDKVFPELVMAQFDFGAEPDIAGEEADEGWLG